MRIFAVKFEELQRVLAVTEENSMTKLTVAVTITIAQSYKTQRFSTSGIF